MDVLCYKPCLPNIKAKIDIKGTFINVLLKKE